MIPLKVGVETAMERKKIELSEADRGEIWKQAFSHFLQQLQSFSYGISPFSCHYK